MIERVPDDRVVELYSHARAVTFGVGRYRGDVVPCGSRWHWRAWDVIAPSLGGRGTLGKGSTRTKMGAIGECTDALRRAAGIEHIPTGGGGPVDGDA